MRTVIALYTLLVACTVQAPRTTALDWLTGCWETPDQRGKEVWVREDDGSLTGFAVDLSAGQVQFYETLRITFSRDGGALYVAHPAGQPATGFRGHPSGDQSITLINENHDYPQKITYRRDGAKLTAEISAMNGAHPRVFEKRACEE